MLILDQVSLVIVYRMVDFLLLHKRIHKRLSAWLDAMIPLRQGWTVLMPPMETSAPAIFHRS